MASPKLFESAPAFPDNVPTVDLPIISLEKLSTGDDESARAMLAACQSLGFFLLDLRGSSNGDALSKEIDEMFDVAKETLSLPLEEKEKYLHNIPKSFLGYVTCIPKVNANA
jgi:isopenicillin N synthase-like dioxygenase